MPNNKKIVATASTPPPTPTPPTPPPPPLPTYPVVGQALLHYLDIEGVRYIFGIPGGGLKNFLTCITDQKKIKFIICRQETGAAFIADGYARVTGKLGVVMVTTGPGATNALTGVMNANADGSPMLLLTGEVAQNYYGEGYLQEGENAGLDIDAIYKAATGYSTVIESNLCANTYFKQTFRDIFTLPNRAAHISLPDNVTVQSMPSTTVLPDSPESYRTIQQGALLSEVTDTLKMLKNAKRPVIFIGNGCRNVLMGMKDGDGMTDTLQDLITFAEGFGIPVITTPDGKGIFPESHPLSLRTFGCASSQWPYYWLTGNPVSATPPPYKDPIDAILVIGSSLGDLATIAYSPLLNPKPEGKNKIGNFYQVDVNPTVIGRVYPLKKGIIAEAGVFIHLLRENMKKYMPDKKLVDKRKKEVAEIKNKISPFSDPDGYNKNSKPLHPARVMKSIQQKLPANKPANIFIDAGNCVGWANHYLEVSHPWRIFSSLSMGPMGFGVGAVIGGKIGDPKATNICITGDGAFMMQGSEISTAQQFKIGAIWIVLEDRKLNMVTQGMAYFFPPYPETKPPSYPGYYKYPKGYWEDTYNIGEPDLAKFAEGLGAKAFTVSTVQELDAILPKVIKAANATNVPHVIVVKIGVDIVPPYYNAPYVPPAPPQSSTLIPIPPPPSKNS